MRILWWIPVGLLALSAGVFLRVRRRRDVQIALPLEPVSGDWLAHARGREEQEW
jgi:cytochrome c-type biogenesis protein CcmH/NrfF